ncbi:MAG: ACT domain-containing protein [Desulfobacterales bacterium]|nr:ACT domain-containing protein [Desulfobacteraceae bacterium]MBT7086970.1 ACT domain-containing protein [Desulfobacterales bacterium]
MFVEQISIFLENKSGRIAEVTSILANAGINIRALSLADTSDFGVLRIIVNDNEKAKVVLKKNDFTVGMTEVVAVEVEDKPGGLHEILNMLYNEGINIEYMYAFIKQSGDNALMIFRFEDPEKASKMLTEKNFTVIERNKIYTM